MARPNSPTRPPAALKTAATSRLAYPAAATVARFVQFAAKSNPTPVKSSAIGKWVNTTLSCLASIADLISKGLMRTDAGWAYSLKIFGAMQE